MLVRVGLRVLVLVLVLVWKSVLMIYLLLLIFLPHLSGPRNWFGSNDNSNIHSFSASAHRLSRYHTLRHVWGCSGAAMLNCSGAAVLRCSGAPVLRRFDASMLGCSSAQLLNFSSAQLLNYSSAAVLQCSRAHVLKCTSLVFKCYECSSRPYDEYPGEAVSTEFCAEPLIGLSNTSSWTTSVGALSRLCGTPKHKYTAYAGCVTRKLRAELGLSDQRNGRGQVTALERHKVW